MCEPVDSRAVDSGGEQISRNYFEQISLEPARTVQPSSETGWAPSNENSQATSSDITTSHVTSINSANPCTLADSQQSQSTDFTLNEAGLLSELTFSQEDEDTSLVGGEGGPGVAIPPARQSDMRRVLHLNLKLQQAYAAERFAYDLKPLFLEPTEPPQWLEMREYLQQTEEALNLSGVSLDPRSRICRAASTEAVLRQKVLIQQYVIARLRKLMDGPYDKLESLATTAQTASTPVVRATALLELQFAEQMAELWTFSGAVAPLSSLDISRIASVHCQRPAASTTALPAEALNLPSHSMRLNRLLEALRNTSASLLGQPPVPAASEQQHTATFHPGAAAVLDYEAVAHLVRDGQLELIG